MARRAATLEDLLNKPARTKDLVLRIQNSDGKNVEVTLKLKAIGSQEYDDLLASNPPTAEQKRDNNTYNPDTFAPELIAACSVEPQMSAADATKLWNSPEWSRGEVTELFLACIEVCSKGLDVPFTAAG
jgi:hypothetical protein